MKKNLDNLFREVCIGVSSSNKSNIGMRLIEFIRLDFCMDRIFGVS